MTSRRSPTRRSTARRLVTCTIALVAMLCVTGCTRDDTSARSSETDVSMDVDDLRCVDRVPASLCTLYEVSLYELITQPRQWHGKRVRVIGYAHFHDEGNQLYTSQDDWRRLLERNSIRLPPLSGYRDSLNARDIQVEGTFDVRAGGALETVTRVEAWHSFRAQRLEDIPDIDLEPKKPN